MVKVRTSLKILSRKLCGDFRSSWTWIPCALCLILPSGLTESHMRRLSDPKNLYLAFLSPLCSCEFDLNMTQKYSYEVKKHIRIYRFSKPLLTFYRIIHPHFCLWPWNKLWAELMEVVKSDFRLMSPQIVTLDLNFELCK